MRSGRGEIGCGLGDGAGTGVVGLSVGGLGGVSRLCVDSVWLAAVAAKV